MPPNQNLATSLELFALEPQHVAVAAVGVDNSGGGSSSTMEDNKQHSASRILRCAVLGCGMMGREHVSYLQGYNQDVRIDYLCDPHEPSLEKCLKVFYDFYQQEEDASNKTTTQPNDPAAVEADDINATTTTATSSMHLPVLLRDETELLQHANHIDLLVIATPNYLHTDMLLRWSQYDLTILLEKPVAISQEQHDALVRAAMSDGESLFRARVWVAMEYRYMPAISKLISLLPTIGQVKMCTIRENRFPFLHKIQAWNRDRTKTGDTLVEKW